MGRLIRVTRSQARAVLTVLRFVELPSMLDRHERKALTHLQARLKAGVEHKPLHPLTSDLDRLEDVLLGTRSRPFHDLIHGRVRDLLSVTLLWTTAEELPVDIGAPLLDLERIADAGWAVRVLDQCAAHGLLVRFPSDDRRDAEDDLDEREAP